MPAPRVVRFVVHPGRRRQRVALTLRLSRVERGQSARVKGRLERAVGLGHCLEGVARARVAADVWVDAQAQPAQTVMMRHHKERKKLDEKERGTRARGRPSSPRLSSRRGPGRALPSRDNALDRPRAWPPRRESATPKAMTSLRDAPTRKDGTCAHGLPMHLTNRTRAERAQRGEPAGPIRHQLESRVQRG